MSIESQTTSPNEAPRKRPVLVAIFVVFLAAFIVYRFVMPWTPLWIDLVAIGVMGVFALFMEVVAPSRKAGSASKEANERAP